MTTPARVKEASEATTAYHAALTEIGVATVADAIELWQHVPLQQRAATAERWLNQAVRLIMGHRTESVRLARAYYRLSRALLTGRTVADPFNPDPSNVTLAMLRHQFAQLAGLQSSSAAPPGVDTQTGEVVDERAAQAHENDPQSSPLEDDDEQIVVDELDRLREQELADERAAEEELRTVLEALGPKNLEGKVSKIDTTRPADEVDAERQKAHDDAGARQAAAGARVAMNGGRSTTWNHMQGDKRALGWVRISTTGTPCGWCAMLISRGVVYRSERTAQFDEDGDLYHDNCHCIAIPVFTRAQYDNDPRFNLNREYSELWPKVTRGLGGKDALSAWRRFIRTQQTGAQSAA